MDERSLTHDSSYMVWVMSDAFADFVMELGVGKFLYVPSVSCGRYSAIYTTMNNYTGSTRSCKQSNGRALSRASLYRSSSAFSNNIAATTQHWAHWDVSHLGKRTIKYCLLLSDKKKSIIPYRTHDQNGFHSLAVSPIVLDVSHGNILSPCGKRISEPESPKNHEKTKLKPNIYFSHGSTRRECRSIAMLISLGWLGFGYCFGLCGVDGFS